MNKILITGGSSTVGKHLKQIIPSAVFLTSEDCDLTDFTQTYDTINTHKPDIVIHLAALVGGIKDNINRPVDYLQQNLLINTNVIRASYAIGVKKLIALSSTCTYPDKVDTYPMAEEDMFIGPPTPTNFEYAYAKRCMVALIEAYNKQYSTNYCYITPSNLYSELDSHKGNKAHYVAALLDKILQQERLGGTSINLLGTGAPLRQFTYAGDVAAMLKIMIESDTYESFNISNPETYSIHELARITLDTIGKTDWIIQYSQPEMDGQYRKDVSIVKLQKLFPEFIFTKFANGVQKSYINKKTNYE